MSHIQNRVCSQLANHITAVSAHIDKKPFHTKIFMQCKGERAHQVLNVARSRGSSANSKVVVAIETSGAQGQAGKKNPAMKYRKITASPLARRVAARYSNRRAVCPAQGIGTPANVGAARATRPVWARFLMVGRVARAARLAVSYSGSSNRGASGHQGCRFNRHPDREWNPGAGRFVGDRP